MKNCLYSFVCLILVMSFMTACGDDGNDETPKNAVEAEESYSQDDHKKELCHLFGINPADYHDNWIPYITDDRIVIALARKTDNRIYVSVYDKNKKSVVYKNTDISYTENIKGYSYEKTFEGRLANIYPRYDETKEGFILNILVWYTESGEITIDTMYGQCIETLLFFDGSTTRSKTFAATSNPYLMVSKWFDNSCVLEKQFDGNICYTVKGYLVFENMIIHKGLLRYVLSNDIYLVFDDRKTQVTKYNVQDNPMSGSRDKYIWSRELNLIDNYDTSIKLEYTIEDSSTSIWAISAKFVWEDGTVKIVRFTLDIETGNYALM